MIDDHTYALVIGSATKSMRIQITNTDGVIMIDSVYDKYISDSDEDDKNLVEWIASLPDDKFREILSILKDRWLNHPETKKWFAEVWEKESYSSEEKSAGAILTVRELRDYAGHTLSFGEKPHYGKILTRVHKRLFKQLDKRRKVTIFNHIKKAFKIVPPEQVEKQSMVAIPHLATIAKREESIVGILVGDAISSLSPDEVKEALRGMDINLSGQSQKKILIDTLATGGVGAIAKLVGKKALKEVVLALIKEALIKRLGKEAVEKIISWIAKKFPQKAFPRLLGWFGWILIAKDVYDIGGEATRITTPLVINISLYRFFQRLESGA